VRLSPAAEAMVERIYVRMGGAGSAIGSRLRRQIVWVGGRRVSRNELLLLLLLPTVRPTIETVPNGW
jgi:hypothetical protein